MKRLAITISLAILLLLLFLPTHTLAAGFDLLRIDPNARSAALGGFPVAMVDGTIEAIEVNPAGLSGLPSRQATATWADHPLDLSAGRVAWAQPTFWGVGGISVSWFSYGEFDRRESFDTGVQGTFGASDLLLTGAWAMPLAEALPVGARAVPLLETLSAGFAVKLLHGNIDNYTSTSIAFDVGLLFHQPAYGNWIGLTLSNMGTQLDDYAGVQENLPLAIRLAGAHRLEHLPLVLSTTLHVEDDRTIYITGAGEFTVSELLQVRAGYSTLASDLKVSGPNDSTAGLTVGFGLTQSQFKLDYALYSMGALGMVHRLTFGASLD